MVLVCIRSTSSIYSSFVSLSNLFIISSMIFAENEKNLFIDFYLLSNYNYC